MLETQARSMLHPYFGVETDDEGEQMVNVYEENTEGLLWALNAARKEFDQHNPPTQKLSCAYRDESVLSSKKTIFRSKCQDSCVIGQQFCPKHLVTGKLGEENVADFLVDEEDDVPKVKINNF